MSSINRICLSNSSSSDALSIEEKDGIRRLRSSQLTRILFNTAISGLSSDQLRVLLKVFLPSKHLPLLEEKGPPRYTPEMIFLCYLLKTNFRSSPLTSMALNLQATVSPSFHQALPSTTTVHRGWQWCVRHIQNVSLKELLQQLRAEGVKFHVQFDTSNLCSNQPPIMAIILTFFLNEDSELWYRYGSEVRDVMHESNDVNIHTSLLIHVLSGLSPASQASQLVGCQQ